MLTAKIKEVFTSIQGEGPYIGVKQLFIRFCECNLNCDYCDTDFVSQNVKDYTVQELAKMINAEINLHSVALTGGEPLLQVRFLKELLSLINVPVYLETNATLSENLAEIIDEVDIVSADIKLVSSSGMNTFEQHKKFFETCFEKQKETFIKIVFDNKITDQEIVNSIGLAMKFDYEIILQPKMIGNNFACSQKEIEDIFEKFTLQYKKTRLIPQTHKFLGVR